MPRLARKPSLWLSLFLRLAFVVIAVLSALWFIEKRRASFMSILIGVIALAAVWEMIRFAVQMRHRPPVLTIDHQPLAFGDTAELQVVGNRSDAEIAVRLIGECQTTAATDISQHREKKVLRTRCYEVELFRARPDRPAIVRVDMPKSPPADGMTWTIVVDSTLKHGDVIEHAYPLSVREG